MCQRVLSDARLYELLLKFDVDLAALMQRAGCPECGGRLDAAPFPRKPRGALCALPEGYDSRQSFCCSVEGCRKRVTPPSVRFLGRKVYLGGVVVLVSAMMNGATPERVARLRELVGASERTLRRWREWWRTAFAESPFWKAAVGRFQSPVTRELLPASLLERFGGDEEERLVAALKFLAPTTTASARGAMAF